MKNVTTKKPISDAKLAANRANARKSTGPKTQSGKARSSKNATKHGLTSSNSPIEAFDAPSHSTYLATLASLTSHFSPADPFELHLVRRLAQLQHRLHRIAAIESATFDDALARTHLYLDPTASATERLADSYSIQSLTLDLLSRYESRLSRDYARTLSQLRLSQRNRLNPNPSSATQPSTGPVAPSPEIQPIEPNTTSQPQPNTEQPTSSLSINPNGHSVPRPPQLLQVPTGTPATPAVHPAAPHHRSESRHTDAEI